MKRIRTLAPILTLAAGLSPVSAAILVVDCVEGPFIEISDALAFAETGDAIAVRPCAERPYAPFAVRDRDEIHILSSQLFARAAVVDGTDGPINCVEIENSSAIAIGGLRFLGCQFHAIEVERSTQVTLYDNDIFNSGVELIRDQDSVGTRIVNNFIHGGTHGIFLAGEGALVYGNVIEDGRGDGIAIVGEDSFVAENRIEGNAGNGILDQGLRSRIEKNTLFGNRERGGDGQIRLISGSEQADVVGNFTRDDIVDLGVGTEQVDNR